MKCGNRFLCAVLVLALILTAMTGCSCGSPADPSDPAAPATTAVIPTTTTMVQPKNPLTGETDPAFGSSTRPVGVMIANNDFIRTSQVNIHKADMYVEMETEGGITRIMAVFANSDRLPDLIGPIRSARSPFCHIVEALDIVYCHAGGSVMALAEIAERGIEDVDALVYETDEVGSGFWRDSDLASSHDYEYTLVSSRDAIKQVIGEKGYHTTQDKAVPWAFGAKNGSVVGDKVQIQLSGLQTITMEYKNGLYYKCNGTIEDNENHIDAEGEQITTSNVITLFSTKFWENELTIDFYLQSGYGLASSGGTNRLIKWSRDESGLHMAELDGSQVQLATGKTYLCVTDESFAAETYTEASGVEGSRVTWSDQIAAQSGTAG